MSLLAILRYVALDQIHLSVRSFSAFEWKTNRIRFWQRVSHNVRATNLQFDRAMLPRSINTYSELFFETQGCILR